MKLRTFMMSDGQWEQIRKIAFEERVSIAEILRQAVDMFVTNFHGNKFDVIREEKVTYVIKPKDVDSEKSDA